MHLKLYKTYLVPESSHLGISLRRNKMKIYIEKENKNLNIKNNKFTGKTLLENLKINPSTVILVKNDEVILEDEILEDNDDIKILSVVSGG